MWLLKTSTFELAEFFDSNTPVYAILSHTWENEEISFAEMQSAHAAMKNKSGYSKIVKFCQLAKARGYEYGWVDTCCIDKRNSADLSEAINSMFRYYYNAGECFIYLFDVPGVVGVDAASREQQLDSFKVSRWFTRGWTLQELLAPKERIFFSGDWAMIDDKPSLTNMLTEITNIDTNILWDRDLLSTFCTAERMSWASKRQTTRSEDMAYSLMGLFNINMPVLYGEGAQRAFRRLQEEILRTSFDQTIFVWRGDYRSSGLLAKSPSDFRDTPRLGLWGPFSLSPSTMTNVGLSIRLNVLRVTSDDRNWLPGDLDEDAHMAVVACDIWSEESWQLLVLFLKPVPEASFFSNGKLSKAYRRIKSDLWVCAGSPHLEGKLVGRTSRSTAEDVLVLEDQHFDLVVRALEDHQLRKDSLRKKFRR
jgi:hypothetical protein